MPDKAPDIAAPAQGQAYTGDISAAVAWEMLESDPAAILIDVRTDAEWTHVGTPDLSSIGKRPLFLEWQAPTGLLNPDFGQRVVDEVPAKDAPLIFICRSGARSASAAAAMTQKGYSKCYNLAGGFEGSADESGHCGVTDGWKVTGLAWVKA